MSEWGPWIDHDGKGCPCVGMYVEVEHQFGVNFIIECVKGDRGWDGGVMKNGMLQSNVIRYRIRKPRGMTILQEIVQNPEREMEDV